MAKQIELIARQVRQRMDRAALQGRKAAWVNIQDAERLIAAAMAIGPMEQRLNQIAERVHHLEGAPQ